MISFQPMAYPEGTIKQVAYGQPKQPGCGVHFLKRTPDLDDTYFICLWI